MHNPLANPRRCKWNRKLVSTHRYDWVSRPAVARRWRWIERFKRRSPLAN